MSSMSVILTLVLFEAAFSVCASDWSFEGDNGPDSWADTNSNCGGDRQSPIDLRNMTVVDEPFVHWAYGFYDTPETMNLTNNGKSVVLTGAGYKNNHPPTIFLNRKKFVLDSIHFHWGKGTKDGTEHTLYGQRFAMEMHAVHTKVDGVGNVVTPEEYAVIAQLFKYREKSNGFPSGLEYFVNKLGKVIKAGTSTSIQPFSWSDLVHQLSMYYYWYEGSMTSPPCSETVTFLIPRSASVVTKDEIEKFRKLMNEEGEPISGNIRPLQNRNGRQISYFQRRPY